MTSPTLLLVCRVCLWRPDTSLEVGDIAAHFTAEHDASPVAMMLISYCPRDYSILTHRFTGVTPDGRNVSAYDCPQCRRTYSIKWTPGVVAGGSR
jgi:transposase-like protein